MTDVEIQKFLLARARPDDRHPGHVMVPWGDLPPEQFAAVHEYLRRNKAKLEPLDDERAALEKTAMETGRAFVIGDEPRGYWFVPQLLRRR